MIRRFLRLLTPATRHRLRWLTASNVLLAILDSIGVLLTVPLIGVLTGATTQPTVVGIELPQLSTPLRTAGLIGLMLLVVFSLRGVLALLLVRRSFRLLHRDATGLQQRLLAGYLHAPVAVQARWRPARLQVMLLGYVPQVTAGVMTQLLAAAGDLLSLAAITLVLLATEPIPSLVALVLLGVAAWTFQRAVRTRMVWAAEGSSRLNAPLVNTVMESARLSRMVKLRHREDYYPDRVSELREQGMQYEVTSQTYGYAPRYYLEIAFLVIAGAVGLTAVAVSGEDQALPAVGLFVVGGFRLLPAAQRLITLSNNLKNNRPQLAEIEVALDQLPVPEESDAGRGAIPDDDGPIVSLRSASFTYPGSEHPALRGISLSVERGSFVGLVGPSGSGKSTLIDVIMGLLDPDSGDVRVCGAPLPSVRRSWQLEIGYVPQEVAIGDVAVAECVAFGCRPEEIDREAVRDALRLAQLDGVVDKLPQGMDTVLGREHALSGGERQRLAIARALYHRPSVLVLDEATSQLDGLTEAGVTSLIRSLKGHVTVLAIAHRLSTVRTCDVVHVLEQGSLVASGSFDALRQELPAFEELVRLTMGVSSVPENSR